MFTLHTFLQDLRVFIGYRTIVHRNRDAFEAAYAWIQAFFNPRLTEFITLEFSGCRSLIIKPKESQRPNVLGDGHIEVVPAEPELFTLRQEQNLLFGRGVADMKTQCLAMMYALREGIETGKHNDFWILFTEDEESGSEQGVKKIVDYLDDRGLFPEIVFAPDGGPDFAYVEKEKGIMNFTARVPGKASHASRPFLGTNAIEQAYSFYHTLKRLYPNPKEEADWVTSVVMTKISAGEASNKIPDFCLAGFDLRFPEFEDVTKIQETIRAAADEIQAAVDFEQADPATYYPRETLLAEKYIEILRRVSGKEPAILHSNGASNGRIYVQKKPDIQILMSNPRVVGSHADIECIDGDSIPAYYELVRETMQLRTD